MLENNRVIIIGGGHAGIEAAFALSRLKVRATIISLDLDAIGRLSCNPAIGGLAKSHLVKEIDALGGVMGHAADKCAIQLKTLNKTKGRAVWALRAQVDKKQYPLYIKKLLDKNKYISLLRGEVSRLLVKSGRVCGVNLKNKETLSCSSVVITCGTFLNGLIHIGLNSYKAGRMGERGSPGLTESLVDLGFVAGRLKTGTPPRISKKSINFKSCSLAPGDETPSFFSIFKTVGSVKNEPCFLINTTSQTHEVIFKNLDKSAMFSGKIKGVGPRYCPSIEDKIFRFKDRLSHHLFLEPEWLGSDQLYVNGFSTSLPEATQKEALKSLPGFGSVEFIRPGYAIEYDYLPPRQLKATLESKHISGLFLAGQMNGTSGYEEAAAQGLVAGANAGFYIRGEAPLVFDRGSSYLGVMVDDLVTRHLDEPYRMFTSRAEHRLFLRPDNAYTRLFSLAKKRKLLSSPQIKTYNQYFLTLNKAKEHIKNKVVYKKSNQTLASLLKRPSVSIFDFPLSAFKKDLFKNRCLFECETTVKYQGYIQNELDRINKNKALEDLYIPLSFNYSGLPGLSNESIERLLSVRPETLGQASRISGIRPTDITILGAHIRAGSVSRET